jgi:hypothetical protein
MSGSATITALALSVCLGASPVAAQSDSHAVVRTMLGDAAIIMSARTDGKVEIAAAGEKNTVQVTVPGSEARQWADSTTKVLRSGLRGQLGALVSYRTELEEPGVTGTGVIFTRRIEKGESNYSIYFADEKFSGFTATITADEARIFVNAVRKTADAARRLAAPAAASKGNANPTKKAPAPTAPKPPAAEPAKKST